MIESIKKDDVLPFVTALFFSKTLINNWTQLSNYTHFPGGSDSKASAYNAGDLGSIPGSGRSPGERKGNPLQYSCLENPMDRGAWWAIFHEVTKSWT